MPVIRVDRNQTWDADGRLVADETVEVDVTAEAVEWDLHSRARTARVNNTSFLTDNTVTVAELVAQVRALTRQVNALTRIVLRDFDDNTDT